MEKHFKQLIIARRDLNKLAAQGFYQVNYRLDEDIYDNWINDGVRNFDVCTYIGEKYAVAI